MGFTADSLLLLDWTSNQTCELLWQRTGCERFCFDYGEVNGPPGTVGCICRVKAGLH